ncbi:MAG: SIMPL domain-containing protein [Gemmatimonadaceae bacterium]|nr:SIMPL domain-containing protein [Gemmatimonadaceae bacterium]
MTRTRLAVALIASLVLGRASAAQSPEAIRLDAAPSRDRGSITTTARAEMEMRPDRASITFAVETRGASAAVAGSSNARRAKAVIDTLRSLGVLADEITTQGVQIGAEYAYEPRSAPRVTGYVARNAVTIEAKNLELVGRLIDAALGAQANNVGGLRFYASNDEAMRRQALAKAVERARLDAEAMAKAAGGTLGSLIELSNSEGFVRPMFESEMKVFAARADVATPVQSGTLKVEATVTARWGFLPR